jgi:hypothetical protein
VGNALFTMIGVNLDRWFEANVIVAAVVAAPLVASYLYDVVLQRATRFASLIANLFAPLFLLMVVVYLATMVIAQRSPFFHREYLIVFNALLLLVLGITLFSVCSRRPGGNSVLVNGINTALVTVTLVMNLIALLAIVFRLSSWGLTPNRFVVTGVNLLIFCHLIGILLSYLRLWRGFGSQRALEARVVGFLPIYGAWAVFILVVLPWLFPAPAGSTLAFTHHALQSGGDIRREYDEFGVVGTGQVLQGVDVFFPQQINHGHLPLADGLRNQRNGPLAGLGENDLGLGLPLRSFQCAFRLEDGGLLVPIGPSHCSAPRPFRSGLFLHGPLHGRTRIDVLDLHRLEGNAPVGNIVRDRGL